MPGRYVAIDLLEGGQAAHRITVEVPGRDVVPIRLFLLAGALEELSQAVMRLGEAGLPGEQSPIGRRGGRGIGGLRSPRGQEFPRERLAFAPRGRRGEEGPVGLEPGVVRRGRDQDRQGADPLRVRDDRLQAAPEVDQQDRRLGRRVGRDVDQGPVALPRRRDRDPALGGRLPDQPAQGGTRLEPLDQEAPNRGEQLVEVMVEVARPVQPRREFVVAAINDQEVRTAFQLAEPLLLELQVLARAGQDLESDRAARKDLAELPDEDVADRDPLLIGDSGGARLAQDHHVDRAVTGRVGELRGGLDRRLGFGHRPLRLPSRPPPQAARRHRRGLVRPDQPHGADRLGQDQPDHQGAAQQQPAGRGQASTAGPLPPRPDQDDAQHERAESGDRRSDHVGEFGSDQQDQRRLPIDPPGNDLAEPDQADEHQQDGRRQHHRQQDQPFDRENRTRHDRSRHPLRPAGPHAAGVQFTRAAVAGQFGGASAASGGTPGGRTSIAVTIRSMANLLLSVHGQRRADRTRK